MLLTGIQLWQQFLQVHVVYTLLVRAPKMYKHGLRGHCSNNGRIIIFFFFFEKTESDTNHVTGHLDNTQSLQTISHSMRIMMGVSNPSSQLILAPKSQLPVT